MANETQEAATVDSTIMIAVVGAISAAIGAAISGFWRWFGGKKKADAEASASLMSGFMLLLGEYKAERGALVSRINELEANNQRQDRHISRLERLMINNGIEVPDEPDEGQDRSGR